MAEREGAFGQPEGIELCDLARVRQRAQLGRDLRVGNLLDVHTDRAVGEGEGEEHQTTGVGEGEVDVVSPYDRPTVAFPAVRVGAGPTDDPDVVRRHVQVQAEEMRRPTCATT
ncbi:hypothetical protein ACF07Z_28585 [Streptomyces albidoflavus]